MYIEKITEKPQVDIDIDGSLIITQKADTDEGKKECLLRTSIESLGNVLLNTSGPIAKKFGEERISNNLLYANALKSTATAIKDTKRLNYSDGEVNIYNISSIPHDLDVKLEGENIDFTSLELIAVASHIFYFWENYIEPIYENGYKISCDGTGGICHIESTDLADVELGATLVLFEGATYLKGHYMLRGSGIPSDVRVKFYVGLESISIKADEEFDIDGVVTKVELVTNLAPEKYVVFDIYLEMDTRCKPSSEGYVKVTSAPSSDVMFVVWDEEQNVPENLRLSVTYNKDTNDFVNEIYSEIENVKLIEQKNNEENRNVFANAIKGNVSGREVVLNDVSPIEHTIKVQLSSESVTDFSNVKLMVSDDVDIIPYPYQTAWDNFSVIEQGYIEVSGTDSGELTCITLFSDLIETGGIYCLYGVNHPLITVEFIDIETGMIQQPILVLDDNMYYKVDNNTPINIELFASHTTDEGIVDIYPKLTKVDVYIPSAKGVVEVKYFSPTMVFNTDTEGVNIEVEYNQDTNKVVKEIEDSLGDIDSALDSIIVIQNELIGGDGV